MQHEGEYEVNLNVAAATLEAGARNAANEAAKEVGTLLSSAIKELEKIDPEAIAQDLKDGLLKLQKEGEPLGQELMDQLGETMGSLIKQLDDVSVVKLQDAAGRAAGELGGAFTSLWEHLSEAIEVAVAEGRELVVKALPEILKASKAAGKAAGKILEDGGEMMEKKSCRRNHVG